MSREAYPGAAACPDPRLWKDPPVAPSCASCNGVQRQTKRSRREFRMPYDKLSIASEETSPRLQLRLSEVRLERFKAAWLPEPVHLRPLTVLIGRNGSGKSTLLEALQWLDTTIRRDAREACDRYFGIHDLINLRSRVVVPFFELTLTWKVSNAADEHEIRYRVRVEEAAGNTPRIAEEELTGDREGVRSVYVQTIESGRRQILGTDVVLRDPDRVSLSVIGSLTEAARIRFSQRCPISGSERCSCV